MTEKPRLLKRVFGAIRNTAKRATMFGLSKLVFGAIGGSISLASAGIDVSAETSLQNAAYFRCVNLIANAVGKTQFCVKQGADEDTGHAANPLLKYWARHHQLSADIFRRTLTIHALLYGNGYARIVREAGRPARLSILNPHFITPELVNGELRYRIRNADATDAASGTTVSASDVIHIKGFTNNGWLGIDPIRYWASETLGLAIATQKYASDYYRNGGQPTAYIYSEHPIGQEQWNNFEQRVAPTLNSDLHNPHRLPLLEQMEIKGTGLNAEQTQLLEARKQSMLEICNMLGIPPHKVGLTQSSAYKSLEEENRAFREDAIEPWLCQFEIEYRKLLTEAEQESESHTVEANRFDLSRTDLKSRFEALAKGTGGAAFLTPNDARKMNGQKQHPDGDQLHKPPTNEKKPGDPSEAGDDDADEDEHSSETDGRHSRTTEADIVRQTLYRVQALTDVYARMTKRLAVEARKRSARSADWPDYLDQLHNRHAATLRSMLDPIIGLCGGRSEDAGRITDALLTEFRDQMAALYDRETRDDFAAAVAHTTDGFERRAADLARAALQQLAS